MNPARALHDEDRLPRRRQLQLAALAAALIVAVYLAGWSPIWLPGDDSAIYRMLGHNLATGAGYTTFGKPHTTVPPGYPLLLAGLEKAGLSEAGINAFTIALALACVALAWLILRRHAGFEWALLIVVGFAVADHMQELSMQMLSDIPCLALVLLGLWLLMRWADGRRGTPVELGSLALVAAVTIRLAVLPLVLGAALGLLLQRRKPSAARAWFNAALLVLGAAGTLGLFYLYHQRHLDPTAPTYAYHVANMGHRSLLQWVLVPLENLVIAGQAIGSMVTSQSVSPKLVAAAIFLPIVLTGLVHRLRRNQVIGAVTALAYVGGIVLLRDIRTRYLLPVAPLLILYFADGLAVLIAWVNRRIQSRRPTAKVIGATAAAAAIMLALAALNLFYDVRTVVSVHGDDILAGYGHGSALPMIEAGQWMKDSIGEGEKFFSTSNAWQLAWFSRRPALPLVRTMLDDPPPPKAVFEMFDRNQVSLFIFGDDGRRRLGAWRQILQAGLDQGRLVELWRNQKFVIYHYK